MKLSFLLIISSLSGCATATPIISAAQADAFRDVVRSAEAAGAGGPPPEAARQLRDAKSDFYYAQHSPMNRDRAHRLSVAALTEAEAARDLAQSYSRHQLQLKA
jgi:hypothetical protein